jgi:subtilase family serine protease
MPPPSADWSLEISLDLDMVSAVCPNCKILLVESNTNLDSDLYTAEDTAARLGANTISNSWGGSEYSGETTDDAHFNHPGVAITASSGDNGYGVSFPAASRYLTAVGGTSLTRGGGTRGWTESAWSGAGSGCSAYEAKPSWQTDSGCSRRTVADVSAVADPNTGVAVMYGGLWWTVGGTSASSPIVASVYALAGNASTVNAGSYPYSHTSGLFDVTSGSNGTCSPSYLCHGAAGYDGPTGLGTPNGVSGF